MQGNGPQAKLSSSESGSSQSSSRSPSSGEVSNISRTLEGTWGWAPMMLMTGTRTRHPSGPGLQYQQGGVRLSTLRRRLRRDGRLYFHCELGDKERDK